MLTRGKLYNWDASEVAATERRRQAEFGYSPGDIDLVIAGADAILKILKESGQYWRHHECWIIRIPEKRILK